MCIHSNSDTCGDGGNDVTDGESGIWNSLNY